MNKIFLVGNLTKDPQKKVVGENNTTLCNFSIAVNRRFSKNQEADFFNISVFGKIAENCFEYLKTGSKVAITGSVQISNYEADGQKKTFVSVVADEVEFLSSSKNSDSSLQNSQNRSNLSEVEPIDDDEDQPF